MKSWMVVLLSRNGYPWNDSRAIRHVVADTAEDAVREAHNRPPTYDVGHALVVETHGHPILVPVRAPAPEWDKPKAGG